MNIIYLILLLGVEYSISLIPRKDLDTRKDMLKRKESGRKDQIFSYVVDNI